MFRVHSSHLTYSVNERKLAKKLDVTVKVSSNIPHSEAFTGSFATYFNVK